jgi:hypothetical protein
LKFYYVKLLGWYFWYLGTRKSLLENRYSRCFFSLQRYFLGSSALPWEWSLLLLSFNILDYSTKMLVNLQDDKEKHHGQYSWRHDTQYNDTQHNDTQYNGIVCDTQQTTFCIEWRHLSFIMLSVAFYLLLCWVSLCWMSWRRILVCVAFVVTTLQNNIKCLMVLVF